MNPTTDPEERIKLHEAVFVTGLVVFAAAIYSVAFTFLAARAYVVDLIDHIKPMRKGGEDAP